MWLKHIRIGGYLGTSLENPLLLEDLGQRNIFIGENNTGKSIFYRFMDMLIGFMGPLPEQPPAVPNFSRASTWLGKSDVECELRFVVDQGDEPVDIFGDDKATPLYDIVHSKQFRVTYKISNQTGAANGWQLQVTPMVFQLQHDWVPVYIFEKDPQQTRRWLKHKEGYAGQHSQAEFMKSINKSLIPALQAYKDGVVLIEAIRPRTHQAVKNHFAVETAAKLFHDLQQNGGEPHLWSEVKVKTLKRVNEVLIPCGIPKLSQIDVTTLPNSGPAAILLYFEHAPDVPIYLHHMGTGIFQLVNLIILLEHSPRKITTVFLEEPEANLHPALVRRFMELLRRYKDVQFFISTHSNMLLTSFEKTDRLYHFSIAKEGWCEAKPCVEAIDKQKVLDALGVSGSSLLQTNCVIWVEGPSDRLYIRKWLEQAEVKGQPLLEGSDYVFVFYGGSVLKHHGFDAEVVEKDIVDIIKVCRFSAVVMDADVPIEVDLDKRIIDKGKQSAKRAIIDQANGDKEHRLAIVTEGREIENDVEPTYFNRAIELLMNLDEKRLEKFELSSNDPYEKEIPRELGMKDKDDDFETAKDKLSREKVKIAENVLKLLEATPSKKFGKVPPYVRDLATFIQKSRVYEYLSPSLDK